MIIDYNGPAVKGPRIRKLDGWQIKGLPANKPDVIIYRLLGWTVEEEDGTKPAARFTSTSPIVSCEGSIVTTASGSKYTLLNPDPIWIEDNNFILDEECVIPKEYFNTWIKDDNWITY
jgi:hypothetical protein